MSYGYGGGGSNPYEQQQQQQQQRGYDDNRGYGQAPAYGRDDQYRRQDRQDDYNQGYNEQYNQGQEAVEMRQYNQGPGGLLNEIQNISQSIDEIEQRKFPQIRSLHQQILQDTDASPNGPANRQVDALGAELMQEFRQLTQQVRVIKSSPEAQDKKNEAQVGRIDRRLRMAMEKFQKVQQEFRKSTEDQLLRQYYIVNPNASESEAQAAVNDPNGGQIFQQALMNSNRQGQARAVMRAVEDRQEAVRKILQSVMELAQMVEDLNTLVVQQEEAVVQIEQKAEQTVDNLEQGNKEIGVAVETARATRKKKWWCLLISILILIVIAIIIVIVVVVVKPGSSNNDNNNNNNNQQQPTPAATTPAAQRRGVDFIEAAAPAISRVVRERMALTGVQWQHLAR